MYFYRLAGNGRDGRRQQHLFVAADKERADGTEYRQQECGRRKPEGGCMV